MSSKLVSPGPAVEDDCIWNSSGPESLTDLESVLNLRFAKGSYVLVAGGRRRRYTKWYNSPNMMTIKTNEKNEINPAFADRLILSRFEVVLVVVLVVVFVVELVVVLVFW